MLGLIKYFLKSENDEGRKGGRYKDDFYFSSFKINCSS